MTRERNTRRCGQTWDVVSTELVDNIIEDIVLYLQKIRIERGVTQYRLSKITGLAHTTIMRIENFATTPSLDALLRIAIALGIDCNSFFGGAANRAHVDDSLHLPDTNTDINNCELCASDSPAKEVGHNATVITETEINGVVELEPVVVPFPQLAQNIYSFWSCEIDAENYLKDVERTLIGYVSCIGQYDSYQTLHSKVEKLSHTLILVLREYFMGQHTSAYELLAEGLNQINISSLYSMLNVDAKLYRARRKKTGRILVTSDFWHIPIEQRIKVASQRYSFPGLPCLYVGRSSDICLLELGCTKKDADVAEFTIKNRPCRILDLTKIFNKPVDSMNMEEQGNFLELLPLVFLCSTEITINNGDNREADKHIKKDQYAAHFRPDYVIPQLLLEYILDKTIWEDNPVVGIQYFSVQKNFYLEWLNGEMDSLEKIKNIVMPIQTDVDFGHCKKLEKALAINYPFNDK